MYYPITGGIVEIDEEDLPLISCFSWYKHGNYARAYIRGTGKVKIYMHRLIQGFPNELEIDHIDGNGLKNIKSNLRNVTSSGNSRNLHMEQTSEEPCIHFAKHANKYRLILNGKHIGYFDTEKQAVEMRNKLEE